MSEGREPAPSQFACMIDHCNLDNNNKKKQPSFIFPQPLLLSSHTSHSHSSCFEAKVELHPGYVVRSSQTHHSHSHTVTFVCRNRVQTEIQHNTEETCKCHTDRSQTWGLNPEPSYCYQCCATAYHHCVIHVFNHLFTSSISSVGMCGYHFGLL